MSAPDNLDKATRKRQLIAIWVLLLISAVVTVISIVVGGVILGNFLWSQKRKLDLKKEGNLADSKGKYDQAIALYSEAIKIDPKDPSIINWRGVSKQNKGDLDAAIADYNLAIQISPNYFYPYYNRGTVKKEKGDFKEAIADYDQAIRINNRYANAYIARATAERSRGNPAV